jgi:hypothetical protein
MVTSYGVRVCACQCLYHGLLIGRLQGLFRVHLEQCFPNFFACGPLLASKNNYGYSHPCSRKYSVYLRTDFKKLRIHTSSIRNNALHDYTFIKLIVARFVGTGGFLITLLRIIRNKHVAN